jgi:hypothetical protein
MVGKGFTPNCHFSTAAKTAFGTIISVGPSYSFMLGLMTSVDDRLWPKSH